MVTGFQAVIFDLDGCLVDSEPLALEAIATEMRELGVDDATPQEIRDRFLGVSIGVICQHVTSRSGRACPADFVQRFEDRVLAVYRTQLRRIAGVEAMLDGLAAEGVAVAIGTGGSIRRMTETLRISGLDHYFTGRAFSADQVARGKPAPDLVLLAAQELGIAPDACVVVEDSPHGVVGAIEAGMSAIGFVGGSHLAGIRQAHVERLQQAGATQVFDSLAEVHQAIRNGRPDAR